ncbi:MAG TPA: ABC transporter ATP-binding protein [Candidatus Limnocylindrales bacterium]
MALLDVIELHTFYGNIHALQGVSLTVNEGEIVSLIGANGAGKSTVLNTISGIVAPRSGQVLLDGEDLTRVPAHEIVTRGVVQVPEGRRTFARLTVEENLQMGGFSVRERGGVRAGIERAYTMFPRLRERRGQIAGTLSGGEQQMLAIGRALMSQPRILLLDEPSMASRRTWSRASSTRSARSTPAARPSCWSSRTPTWRSRSPAAATSCRPAGSCSPTTRRRCATTRRSGAPTSARRLGGAPGGRD